MRLLYWTGLFPPFIGGLETFSLELLHELQRRGHEVLVVSVQSGFELPEFSDHLGIPVHRFDFSRILDSRNLAEVNALLHRISDLKRDFAPDVVHMNDGGVGLFFHYHTTQAFHCPTVATIHDPLPVPLLKNSLRGRVLLNSNRVIAVSQAIFQQLLAFAPEMAAHTSVLLHGLTMPPLDPAPLPYDPPHFLLIGRVVPDKGFDLALDAFAMLLPDFPALRVTVAGDGMSRAELETQARRLGIDHAIRFTSWVMPADVPALINTATAVVVPSRWQEPFGLVAVEGAQMARPLIVTRVGALPEIVLDGETGLVVEPENSAALAAALRFVLENPGAAARMGAAAREHAQRNFSVGRMVDEYEQLFLSVAREAKI